MGVQRISLRPENALAPLKSFITVASASGNDRPIWLLIDSEAAGLDGSTGMRRSSKVDLMSWTR